MAGRVREVIPSAVRRAVTVRDRGRCRYCGRVPVRPLRLQLDHVHPSSRGGVSTAANLVVSCSTCNRIKSGQLGVVPMPLTELVDIDEGRAPIRAPLARSTLRGTGWMTREQMRAWVGTGQKLGSRAKKALIVQHPLASSARCDQCSEWFLVGITGRLNLNRATLVCLACINGQPMPAPRRPTVQRRVQPKTAAVVSHSDSPSS